MTPLVVRAHLRGAVCMPHGGVALDGLIAWAVATRDNLPPPANASECVAIDVPLAREPGGRFHLCSVAAYDVELRENRWLNRRFPLPEAQEMGSRKFRRINISAGAQKTYRLPLETFHVRDDVLTWWAIGDGPAVAELLGLVSYVGKKRSTGLGSVARWDVDPCEPWPGFPVVRDGKPMRHLPPDWPGLVDPPHAMRTLTYPYWDYVREELCAVPWQL